MIKERIVILKNKQNNKNKKLHLVK